jgi:hypothetical protein
MASLTLFFLVVPITEIFKLTNKIISQVYSQC